MICCICAAERTTVLGVKPKGDVKKVSIAFSNLLFGVFVVLNKILPLLI